MQLRRHPTRGGLVLHSRPAPMPQATTFWLPPACRPVLPPRAALCPPWLALFAASPLLFLCSLFPVPCFPIGRRHFKLVVS